MLTPLPKTKRCFKCGSTLSLDEFYTHPRMADGHLNKCKECTKIDVRWQRRNDPSVQERDRKRPRDLEAKRKYNKAYHRRYPYKKAAHCAVAQALKRGDLVKSPCEQCGDPRVEAHHDDYSRPLDVRWLCPLCHRRWHADHGTDYRGGK